MSDLLASSGKSRILNWDHRGWGAVLWTCIILAALLRAIIFPHRFSPSEVDEPSYLADGLLVAEGITPAHKYAPSGPLTWFGFVYAGIGALISWLSDQPDVSSFPSMLRPAAALEATLFGIYADMSSLRLAAVSLIVLLSLVAVGAACRSGRTLAGASGAIIGGLLAAGIPLYADLSTQTRPYAIAWSFALLAFAAVVSVRGRRQTLISGIFLGLAVGSHVDMARIAPLILLVQWRSAGTSKPPWRDFGAIVVAAAITFLLIAPWYVTHLADNLRQILTVRVLRPQISDGSIPLILWWNAGLVTPLAIAIVGLFVPPIRRHAPDLLCGLWLLFNAAIALFPSSHGLHHDGALLVAIIGLAPIAVAKLRDQIVALQAPVGTAFLVMFASAPAVWQGATFSLREAHARASYPSIAWIEQNVSPGTRVYEDGAGIATLLPTVDAAERLWDDVAAPDAWLPKYVYDTTHLGFGGGRPLRVMSDDRMAADYGVRRRYAILAAPLQPNRPRYDLWIVSDGSFYDVPKARAVDRLCSEGGIYVHNGAPVMSLPPPAAAWVRPNGNSTYIYRVSAGACPAPRTAS